MRYLVLLLTMLIGQSSLAATNRAPPNCARTHSTPELNACEDQRYEAADRALNSEYKKTRARLPPAAQAKLLAEQRAWVKQRDPKCRDALSSEEGGTIWTSLYSICLADATRARTSELRIWKAM